MFFFFFRYHASSPVLSSPPPLLLITRTSFLWSLPLVLTPSVSPCWHTHIEMCRQLGVFIVCVLQKWKKHELRKEICSLKENAKYHLSPFSRKDHFSFLGTYCRAHTCTYTPVMYPSGVTLAFWLFENLSKYARAHYKWWQFGPVHILALHISSLCHCVHPIL